MGHHSKPDIDPAYEENARNLWQGFIKLSKWCAGIVIVVLILMGLFLL
tara:strand:+ start:755 stop:898 length:144 start_codon:yes stop_codon:yes gene_type:complete